MRLLYILDEHGQPKPCEDVIEWAEWREQHDRHVAQDMDESEGPDRTRVSTIFLGVDHSWFGEGPPILWETMVFGGVHDRLCRRYCSLEDAIVGHQVVCQLVRESRG